jgi:cytochrome c553
MEHAMRFPFSFVLLLVAILATSPLGAADPALGEQIYQAECANCHGDRAQGGKGGEYPRLAGQRADYIQLQLGNFRDRKRQNKPMLPIFKAGKLRAPDIEAVAAYLAGLPVPASAEVGVPEEVEGDLEFGFELYEQDCILCHGADGRGKEEKGSPQLVAQYPRYIAKQMADFRNGERPHEHAEKMFGEAYEDELDALLAYVLSLNHQPPAQAEGGDANR